MITFYKILFSLILVLNTQYLFPQWVQTNGPAGGSVNRIASIGTSVFANYYGVYISTNGGTNWAAINLHDFNSMSLFGSDIYAATSLGVFCSSNNGSDWVPLNSGLTNINVHSFLISGQNMFAGTDSGIFLSTNYGIIWSQLALNNYSVIALAVNEPYIFAGTTLGGVFISSDNGTNWSQQNNGLFNHNIQSLIFNGTNFFTTTGSGVFTSSDNGASWQPTNSVYGLLYTSGSDIYIGQSGHGPYGGGGVYISTNNGMGWKEIMNYGSISAVNINGNTIYASVSDYYQDVYGLYCSTDKGLNWTVVGLPLTSVYSLCANGNNIFSGTDKVYRSTNNGTNWNVVASFYVYTIYSIVFSGSNLFVGSDNFKNSGGAFLSTDNGNSWTTVNNGLSDRPNVHALAVIENNIFAGTWGPFTPDPGVFLSTNNGTNWTKITSAGNLQVNAFAVNGTDIYAGTNRGVYLGSKIGAQWTQFNNGLTDSAVYALASIGSNLYAGTKSGIFASINGANWVKLNNGLGNPNIHCLQVIGPNILAGTDSGVFLLNQNDSTWIQLGQINNSILSLSANETNIYAGTYKAGVWFFPIANIVPVQLTSFSANIGNGLITLIWKTATELNNMGFNIERSQNKSDWSTIAFVPGYQNSSSPVSYSYVDKSANASAKYYYRLKQLDDNGTFKYSDIIELAISPHHFDLHQNYPNPFNPSTVISFSLPYNCKISLNVFNAIGENIQQLYNGIQEAGNHRITFNASNLSSGAYFYSITASSLDGKQNFRSTKKMIFIK